MYFFTFSIPFLHEKEDKLEQQIAFYSKWFEPEQNLSSKGSLTMTSTQVVKTSVTTTDNSPSQDYTHLDNQTTLSQMAFQKKLRQLGKHLCGKFLPLVLLIFFF